MYIFRDCLTLNTHALKFLEVLLVATRRVVVRNSFYIVQKKMQRKCLFWRWSAQLNVYINHLIFHVLFTFISRTTSRIQCFWLVCKRTCFIHDNLCKWKLTFSMHDSSLSDWSHRFTNTAVLTAIKNFEQDLLPEVDEVEDEVGVLVQASTSRPFTVPSSPSTFNVKRIVLTFPPSTAILGIDSGQLSSIKLLGAWNWSKTMV